MNGIKMITIMLLVTVISLAVAKADEVNLDIEVNGTADFNISIDTEDSELREDVYGPPQSDPEDQILQYIQGQISDEGDSGDTSIQSTGSGSTLDEMKEFCYDPAFEDYFKTLGSVPPEGFIEHLKALGYDDESHINLIWSMCLEERINDNEEDWGTDTGISQNRVANLIEGAIEWLFGQNPAPMPAEVEIGQSLDNYFASDADAYYLLRRINDLSFRVEALEHSMDEIASEAYCRGKLQVMMDYGLEGVRCDDTTYFNHQLSPTGEDMVIGITPINGIHEEEPPEIPEEIPTEDETEDTEEVLASVEEEEIVLDKTELLDILMMINSEMDDLTRGVLLVVSSYTLTILTLQMAMPRKKGYMFIGMISGLKGLGSFLGIKRIKVISDFHLKIKKFLINQKYNLRIFRLNVKKKLKKQNYTYKKQNYTYRYRKGWAKV